jgi:hypothetical protein
MTDMMTHGSFGWNELATTDPAAARKFFGGLLGWTFDEVPMPGGGGSYVIAKAGGQRVAGLFKMTGERFKGVPSHWVGYITVSDIEASAKKVPSLGGQMMMPPTDIPNVGRFCLINDPSGATVALMQWAAQMM